MSSFVKISNEERIARILLRICESNLKLLMRTSKNSTTAIRGEAVNVYLGEDPPRLLISKISAKGSEILKKVDEIWVEFIMMSTKIVFKANRLSEIGNSIYISVPKQLISIERRQNMRYPISLDNSAFYELDILKENIIPNITFPTFSQFSNLQNRLLLTDISMGGACAISHFPFVKRTLQSNTIDNRAKLFLPVKAPINLPVEIRWFKKIKEHFESYGGRQNAMTTYKIGLQFLEDFITEESRNTILQYINELTHSQAI